MPNGRMNAAEMREHLADPKRGGVIFNGQMIKRAEDVPSDKSIEEAHAANRNERLSRNSK